ncbi:ketoacyl-ACP synthase III family protein [Streptomyces sp. NPDC001941]|uniref:ketoacyl-ACP synthase III family protein n=1 Tax=Streptomyces sp. NPDC001941 TaxID=3154659 RepID=UPI003319E73B
MRWSDMYVAGTGLHLPAREQTRTAVDEGRYDADECEVNGYTAVAVSDGTAPADMAVRAARDALKASGHAVGDVAMSVHSSVHHQGVDHWTPATYIQGQVLGPQARGPAFHIDQASVGGLSGLTLALSHLHTQPGARAALVTTADAFTEPVYDRYRSEKWFVLGDGGTAVVASRTHGFARVLSTALVTDPSLEPLYRGSEGLHERPHHRLPLDLRARKRGYVAEAGVEDIAQRENAGLRDVVKEALDDAGVSLDRVAHCVLPNVGRALLQWQYLDVLGVDTDRTTLAWGATVGHIGGGDQFGGLHHLVESGTLTSGDHVLLVGSAIGFHWACAVLEII